MSKTFRAWYNSDEKQQMVYFGLFETDEGYHIRSGCMLDGCPTMQFTTKKDKNETDIYEGDILSVDGENMVVEWDGENLQWCVKGNPDLELWYVIDDGSDSFVVGNIYENPELAK